MKEDFILPDIGEGIVECELVEWLVSVGDQVEEDQPVADVQTDKALVQIPAKHAGRVEKFYVEEGEIAKVHAPLFQMEIAGEGPEESSPARDVPDSAPEAKPSKVEHVSQSVAPSDETHRKVLATPAVRRIARENDVNIAEVSGTGPSGRVLKEDMLNYLDGEPSAANTSAKTQPVSGQAIEEIPLKGIRAVMAEQMQKSVSTIPHFTYAEEIDITACNALRRELNDSLSPDDVRLTLMAFFIKSLSVALTQFPIVNSHMNETGDTILQHRDHNIGMAVDSPMGLLVPNIKAVNRRSLSEVAAEVRRLTEAGRAGRLSPDDMKGGTITISNIGAIGGTVTTPIINKPEVAIVGIGRIQSLPRGLPDGSIGLREVLNVSWSGDHRVLDGGTIARFNNEWKRLLEQPSQMLLSLV
ncbi:2-oxo acid dehydrogenase subunit E2 [Reinekea blandensis]|nr:2-oxo acid dehydrogenase subunit E2 [Reinekea blandensis]